MSTITHPAAGSRRLRKQGFANQYRKPLFITLLILLTAYYFYTPDPWHPADSLRSLSRFSGMIALTAGIIIRILSTLTIGGKKDRVLVTTELYSVCRNPLYFASFLMTLGTGLATARWDFTIIIAASFLSIFGPMMKNEADFLRKRFPEFTAYECRVPLFFPDFSLWQARPLIEEVNFRLILRTTFDSLLVFLLPGLLLCIRYFAA